MATNITTMGVTEIEHYVQLAHDYLSASHPTRELIQDLNGVFPAWVLANASQMAKLREMGFSREDYHGLRRKIAHDNRKMRQ